LKKIKCPTFVIHGKSDSLISISHADKLAVRIPDSIKYYVDGMGYDLSSFAINPI
jgi:pimeloyl-ACP methyl ester carboxylesterase